MAVCRSIIIRRWRAMSMLKIWKTGTRPAAGSIFIKTEAEWSLRRRHLWLQEPLWEQIVYSVLSVMCSVKNLIPSRWRIYSSDCFAVLWMVLHCRKMHLSVPFTGQNFHFLSKQAQEAGREGHGRTVSEPPAHWSGGYGLMMGLRWKSFRKTGWM